ncbi:carnosine synthase 1 isoform X1 [Ambystoma mexicanum]|uniref:carnosine synthase 1 isoform X1 n=1 Tax=Ambystoma mexicanum TaxID=8296 RepID=UPI0037E7F055
MISLEQISRKAPVLCKDLDLCHLEGLGLSSFSPLGSLWKRDLSPDGTESPAESDDSVWTEKCYSHLQATLKQAGLPVTVDRTKEPRTGYSLSDITICILGAPSTFLPVLLEGGNLCPGDMLLCLSPAWLSKVPSASHHSECTLLVHKAVTFDLGGRSYLDEFEVPRRVTYFTGSFGMPQWESLPGLVALGCDLECPSGGSDLLAHILEDTLRMRLVLDRSGVLVPPTLAFTYRRTHMASGHVRTVMISKKDGEENLLQEATQNFLQSQGMDTIRQVICAVGRVDKPLNHKTSIPQTLETTLQQWGVRDEAQRKAIDLQIMEMAQTAMEAVIEMEAGLLPEQRGGRRAQTDIIGVDFMLTSVDQVITPVALGVNCHLCLETCGLFESMNRPHVSAASSGSESTSSLLIQTMVKRSQYYIMEGKEVLVIGAGGISKKFIWESTRDHGIKVHLIESDPNHFASCIVHNFIHYDVTDHKRDEEHAQWIVEMVRGHSIQLDGCLSFWDDCMVLTALVCEQLCLRCSPVSAMRISKQKSRTHLHLLHHKEDSACLTTAAPFAVPCCHLESHSDVEKASHYISFPGVMKLEFGAGAVGVKLVENLEQCHQHYEKISSDLKEDTDYPGIGLGWGNAMLLMEYVSGTEHDVDIIIYDGRLMAAFVSDNGPTRVPYFTETAACMPTYLPPDKEAQLVTAAYQCCLGCGLANGVFNVELKMTPTGPKLIEINPRMGGFYLRDWIQEIYGEDIMLASVMVACSVPPLMPVHHARPRTYLVGVMCVVSLHLWALKTTASMETLKSLHKKGVIRLNMLDDDMISSEYEEPFCNVACASETREKARLQLISTCRVLGIDTMEYPVSYFTSDFK